MEGQWQGHLEGTHSFTFSPLHRLSCFWGKCDGVSAFCTNHFHTEGQTKKETKKETRRKVNCLRILPFDAMLGVIRYMNNRMYSKQVFRKDPFSKNKHILFSMYHKQCGGNRRLSPQNRRAKRRLCQAAICSIHRFTTQQ